MPVCRFNLEPLATALTQGSTILVPNQRIRESLLAGHADAMPGEVWQTPPVYAIDIWLRTLWQSLASQGIAPFCDQVLLGSSQESLTWQRIIDGMRAELPLLNTGEAARQAQAAYQLLRMWLDCKVSPDTLPGFGVTMEQRLFRNWYAGFQSACKDAGMITLADATQTLIDCMASIATALPPRLTMINFHQPPPLYQRLFEALAGYRPCDTILTGSSKPAVGQLHSFPDFRQEIGACANWAQQIMRAEPHAHIGIIFDGDDRQRSMVDRLFADQLAPASLLTPEDQPLFNSVRGNALLSAAGPVHDALLLLSLGAEDMDGEAFCRLLQSPHTGGYNDELEPRLQLEIQLRDRHGSLIRLSRALQLMSKEESTWHCPILAGNLLRLQTASRQTADRMAADAWCSHFEAALDILGWPGQREALSLFEHRCLTAWQAVLADFAAAGRILGPMTRTTALARLRSLCRARNLSQSFDHRRQLSLYTLDEAVGLEFSHVWCLNFNDEVQPGPASPSPFLPYALQQQSAHPGSHADRRLERARQSFGILRASTTDSVHASFHEADGDQRFRPSSLAAALQPAPIEAPAMAPLNQLAWRSRSAVAVETSTDSDAIPLQATDTVTGGQQILSNQSACPFRAFARHRLEATSLEEFSTGLDSRLRGSAVHRALERLFKDIPDSATLLALDDQVLTQHTETAGEAAVEYLSYQRPDLMTPRLRALEQSRIAALLKRLLETERLRGNFQVIAREQRCQWDIEPLTISLSIDRIDRLADGSLAIIDYKTGKLSQKVGQLADRRPDDLQLPIYFCASTTLREEPVSGVVITHVNVENIGYSARVQHAGFHPDVLPVGANPGDVPDWETLTAGWWDTLPALAAEFGDGIARVDPANGVQTCRYCGLQPLCRIGELDQLLHIGDDEEPFDADP